MIAFGTSEIIMSQIPNFDKLSWLSVVAAVMSFTYSGIGLALGIAKVAGKNSYIYYYYFEWRIVILCLENIWSLTVRFDIKS